MSRQVKRWIAMGVLGAILAVTFVQLGQWQLRRLEERRERNATVVAHESEGVQPYADVMNKVIEEEDQWYRVTATGTYLPTSSRSGTARTMTPSAARCSP